MAALPPSAAETAPPEPLPPAAPRKPRPGWQALALRVAGVAFVVGLSVLIIVYSSTVEEFARYGYPGIFLFSVLASATVILPAPSLVIVFSMGAVLNPFWVAVLAGVGASLGELSGYLAGFSGNVVVENTQTYLRIQEWMRSHPRFVGVFLFVLAFLPLPFFDMAGLAAGALRVPVFKFLAWIVGGKILKMLVVAYLGSAWFAWFLPD